jgi:serine/threonine protein phosphatase PrpC
MGGGVSKEKVEEMRDEFLKEDTNNDGTVSLNELKKYRQKAEGDKYDEASVEADFQKFDKNGDGHLQLDEYLETHGVSHKVAEKVYNEESVKHAMGEEVLTRADDERHLREEKLATSEVVPATVTTAMDTTPPAPTQALLFKSVAFAEDANPAHRESNEDAHIINADFNEGDSLFAVLDGHGGREVVDAACENLPANIIKAFSAKASIAENVSQSMEAALQDAFATTDQQMPRRVPQFKMTNKLDFCGCTAVVAWLHGSVLVTANIGDARAVLGKADGSALRLTTDHKATADAERALVEGKGGAIEDGRVQGTCAVTRAFGDHGLKQFMSCEPFTTVTNLEGGGFSCLVLACDGVWDVMSDEEAIELVTDASLEPDEAATQLVQEALRKGSEDNITAMVVFF